MTCPPSERDYFNNRDRLSSLVAQGAVHDFAGRGVRQGINDVVDARPLVRGQHGTVRAVLLQLLNGEGGIARHNICRNNLAAQLDRRPAYGAL